MQRINPRRAGRQYGIDQRVDRAQRMGDHLRSSTDIQLKNVVCGQSAPSIGTLGRRSHVHVGRIALRPEAARPLLSGRALIQDYQITTGVVEECKRDGPHTFQLSAKLHTKAH